MDGFYSEEDLQAKGFKHKEAKGVSKKTE